MYAIPQQIWCTSGGLPEASEVQRGFEIRKHLCHNFGSRSPYTPVCSAQAIGSGGYVRTPLDFLNMAKTFSRAAMAFLSVGWGVEGAWRRGC